MPKSLIAKLERFTKLSNDDKLILQRVGTERVRHCGPREDILREGERPTDINLILSGWACRYKQLPDGRRQIIAFFLPGDLCDHNIFILREMDHSVGTITKVAVAGVSQKAFEEVTLGHPRITQALWWEALVTSAIQREWTVNLGQRNATERMAHLLCELFLRLQTVNLTDGNSCSFPLTQRELADATGLTDVHVNRILQTLRSLGLIELKNRLLVIPKLDALMHAAMFNTNYLHLSHEGQQLDANDSRDSPPGPSVVGGASPG
jgi:CRP-like cAMP-binding protein